MTYYPINEDTAKRANDANSFRDYKPGSATAAYRAEVDKAAALVEKQKAKVDPMHHDKLDGLLDRYAHRLADYYNDYYRKHGTLDGCTLASEEVIRKIKIDMKSSWRFSDKPFESYTLSNQNAEIRRLRGRIEELRKQKTEPPPAGWDFDGGEVVVSTSANRLQIIFYDKPDDDLRQELKQYGFRWAPSVGAWQRQLTKNALYAAKRIEALAPVEK